MPKSPPACPGSRPAIPAGAWWRHRIPAWWLSIILPLMLTLAGCVELDQDMTVFPDGRLQMNLQVTARGEAATMLAQALAKDGEAADIFRIKLAREDHRLTASLQGKPVQVARCYRALAALLPASLAPRGNLKIRNYLLFKTYTFIEDNPGRGAPPFSEMPPGLSEPQVQKRLHLPGRLISANAAQRENGEALWVLTMDKLIRGYTIQATSIEPYWPGITLLMVALVLVSGIRLTRRGGRRIKRLHSRRKSKAMPAPSPSAPAKPPSAANLFHRTPYDDRK